MADPSPGSLAMLPGGVSFDVLHARSNCIRKMKQKACALQSRRDPSSLIASTTKMQAPSGTGPSMGLLSTGPGCAPAEPAASQGTLPGCLCRLPDLGDGREGGIHAGH